ncbi:MAG TPA: MFS transporter, partial [Candidatus Lustribacter sp.]|nr:MFS transporter [Candidatus Lustribacter sp.]
MTFLRDLRILLAYGGFRRLLGVRLTSQSSDGLFQAALATLLLFNPERAPSAAAIAGGFAVLLLPFSVLGPFAGVFLDRWPRRAVLVTTNLVRALLLVGLAVLKVNDQVGGLFVVLVLAVLGLNRFLLAGLSASLPHVVDRDKLVTANAVTPTCGTLAYLVGIVIGGVLAEQAPGYTPFVAAAGGYLAAALIARTMPDLGPDLAAADASVRAAVRHMLSGISDAATHLPRTAQVALGLVTAIRIPVGIMIVATILYFRAAHPPGASGVIGFGSAVVATGVGFAVAAVATPALTRRFGVPRTVRLLATASGAVQLLALPFAPVLLVAAAFGLGATTQSIKICIDTILQRDVSDAFRGRVFALYDILFNVAFVAATAIAALVLPPTGRSAWV